MSKQVSNSLLKVLGLGLRVLISGLGLEGSRSRSRLGGQVSGLVGSGLVNIPAQNMTQFTYDQLGWIKDVHCPMSINNVSVSVVNQVF